jgi:hypothetical protein
MLKTYRGSAYIFADIGLEITGTASFDPNPDVCERIDGTMACKAQGYNQARAGRSSSCRRGARPGGPRRRRGSHASGGPALAHHH